MSANVKKATQGADVDEQKETDYAVTTAREYGGIYRQVGDVVRMHPKAAAYYLQPYGSGLEPAAASDAAGPASGKARRSVA